MNEVRCKAKGESKKVGKSSMVTLLKLIHCGIIMETISKIASFLGATTIACITLITLMTLPSRSLAQEPPALTQTLDIEVEDIDITVHYPNNWSVAPEQFVNSWKLINVPADQQETTMPTARVKISTETRIDHAEAIQQLQELGTGLGVSSSEFLEIGGWPALQVSYIDVKPQPGQSSQSPDTFVLRITTAIAAGKLLVYLDATLPSDANQTLINEAKAISSSVVFSTTASPEQVQEELDKLRSNPPRQPSTPGPETQGSAVEPVPPGAQESGTEPPPGQTQRLITGRNGELEIAVSPDGQNIVIGQQSVFVTSNNGGHTFPISGTIGAFDGGDPSLAFGVNRNFYYAGIDGGCRSPTMAAPFGFTCTGMARSSDNGTTFPLVTPAVVCPNPDPNPNDGITPVAGSCFPDQEHIAADRVNGAPGGDQVYSTWRNFDATDQDAGLVCSQDSGQNWTAPFDLGSNSQFPRITVGQDGFVYVAAYRNANYRIWKFSPCTPPAPGKPGLVLQPGFPTNVPNIPPLPFTRVPVACPFPGHDRCDQNPSSQTVAVDDTNPNHVYYAFAENTASGNEDIIVHDSLDGGLTWLITRRVRVNTAVTAKRIMPWMCTRGGEAFVTWYDRRNAAPCPSPPCPGINNDLTDYFAGSVRLDSGGNLVAGTEFRITEVADPWCASGWPCATRQFPSASESCSQQPQLAGVCCLSADDTDMNGMCDSNTAGSSQNACDFSDTPGVGTSPCQAGEACVELQGSGCPKYGDYNGNACAAGRLFAAWASATPPSGIGASGGIDIFFTVVPPFRADLSITKTDSADPVTAEADALTYTIAVTNNGPDTASGVTVTDTLPPGVTFIQGLNCSESGGTVSCKRGDGVLVNGASDSFEILVTPTTAAIGTITNRVSVKSNEVDPNTENNSATQDTTVIAPPPADLAIVSIDDSPDPVTVGDQLTYTVNFVNNGPGTTFGGTVENFLPAEVTFVSSNPPCSQTGSFLTCPFGNIGSGTNGQVNIVVTPTIAVAGGIVNVARVRARNEDPDETNNVASATTTVRPAPEVVNNLVKFEPIESTFNTTSDKFGCPSEFAGKFSFTARLTNTSNKSLSDLLVEVATLTNGNLMQTNRGLAGGVGTRLDVAKVGGFSDGVLSPTESVDVPFVICLRNRDRFSFFVDVFGIVR